MRGVNKQCLNGHLYLQTPTPAVTGEASRTDAPCLDSDSDTLPSLTDDTSDWGDENLRNLSDATSDDDFQRIQEYSGCAEYDR